MEIPKTMMAIVKTKKERGAEYLEVPVPSVGADEVLVKVHAAAICGTDIHMYQWNDWAKANGEKVYSKLPRILGHEFSGEIVAKGENVKNVDIGVRVACETHLQCGECYLCRTGNTYNCQNIKRFENGVYAEYVLVPAAMLIRLPDNISYDQGTVMEPFSIAVHGASKVRVVGDTVAVIGSGPIGLFTIMIVKAMGASKIFAVDVSEYRLELAKKSGADIVINPSREDVVSFIKKATENLGCGTVFDTSGSIKAIQQGFKYLRKCGTMIMEGLPSEPLVLDTSSDIVLKAAKIFGVYGREIFNSWEIAKGLIGSCRVDVNSVLTHRFKFSEFEKGFELAEAGLAGKVILYPDSILENK